MAGQTILIAAGTTAASNTFKIPAGAISQLVGFGFSAAGETIALQVSYDGGDTYVDCYDSDGVQVLIGGGDAASPRNPVAIIGPGFFKVVRSAGGTDSIGVSLVETTIP